MICADKLSNTNSTRLDFKWFLWHFCSGVRYMYIFHRFSVSNDNVIVCWIGDYCILRHLETQRFLCLTADVSYCHCSFPHSLSKWLFLCAYCSHIVCLLTLLLRRHFVSFIWNFFFKIYFLHICPATLKKQTFFAWHFTSPHAHLTLALWPFQLSEKLLLLFR